jgi:curved DNA-binding protein
MFIDYYKILGVSKDASQKDIKAAYRKLARKYHPDLNPDDKDAKKNFQQVNEANEVLGDPEKRKKYDQYGHDWQHAGEYQNAHQYQHQSQGRQQQYSGGWQDFAGNEGDNEFSDFFESLFGNLGGSRGRSRRTRFRGEDYSAELQISLREAYTTHKRELNVNGKKIRITIPAGIEDGQTIKIAGHGGPGMNGGSAGDLYIKFLVADDPDFKRVKNDLYKAVSIDLYTAVLGGEIITDTINGKIKLTVKPGTGNGTKIKLRGKGFPVYKSEKEYGDLYITFNVEIPTYLTEKEKELFTELAHLKKKAQKS